MRAELLGSDRIECELPYDCGAARAFDAFTNPEALATWWGKEAFVDPGIGGGLKVLWPEQGFEFYGTYFEFSPDRSLGYTWNWKHSGVSNLRVRIEFQPKSLKVTHSGFTESQADQISRKEILEGWTFFLPRLSDYLAR
ncbi:MAG TPA: SRPBCC domain-containing protein [Fimbriimonadaceae bacterium]|nr:SRPBCC domain-containing protein [Fimbriimonadaceae bacterium]